MAKPGLAQEQTVEEILASIRQAIDGEHSRSKSIPLRPVIGAVPSRNPGTAAEPPRGGTVTPIHGTKTAYAGEDPVEASGNFSPRVAGPGERLGRAEPVPPAHDVIELAIEQAIDGLKPASLRADTIGSSAADRPLQGDARPPIEPTPAREMSRFTEPQVAREVPATVRPAQRPSAPPAGHGLLSPRTNAAVAASFDDLARALASHGSRDIDQTVEDLLRPMLKSWLEDNLPSLVERLVREEIERVSRGRR